VGFFHESHLLFPCLRQTSFYFGNFLEICKRKKDTELLFCFLWVCF
jgi:hypothetical protein